MGDDKKGPKNKTSHLKWLVIDFLKETKQF